MSIILKRLAVRQGSARSGDVEIPSGNDFVVLGKAVGGAMATAEAFPNGQVLYDEYLEVIQSAVLDTWPSFIAPDWYQKGGDPNYPDAPAFKSGSYLIQTRFNIQHSDPENVLEVNPVSGYYGSMTLYTDMMLSGINPFAAILGSSTPGWGILTVLPEWFTVEGQEFGGVQMYLENAANLAAYNIGGTLLAIKLS